jgi:hypothetical protein
MKTVPLRDIMPLRATARFGFPEDHLEAHSNEPINTAGTRMPGGLSGRFVERSRTKAKFGPVQLELRRP